MAPHADPPNAPGPSPWLYALGLLPALMGWLPGETRLLQLLGSVVVLLVMVALRQRERAVRRHLAALSNDARTDALTGLKNRRAFLEQLEAASAAAVDAERVSIAYFDLDGFKQVNDALGHAAGDMLLTVTARLLEDNLRAGGDAAFRLGGDEFAVLLRDTDAEEAQVFTRRVRDGLTEYARARALPQGVGVSVGVAMLRPGEAPHHALERADAAMYECKRDGRRAAAADGEGRLEALHQRYAPQVFRRAERLLGDRAGAEDVTTHVLQALVERDAEGAATRSGWRSSTDWLYRVTTHLCLDRLRGGRRVLPGGDPSSLDWVREKLGQARRLEAEAAVYVYLDGLSARDAGALLGMPERQVDALLERFGAVHEGPTLRVLPATVS
ncbi:MAG: diguanylate cyclase [Myxococcaceae bacterium]|nr:diguanylate cyclase [Myxococcaceae bacterium]